MSLISVSEFLIESLVEIYPQAATISYPTSFIYETAVHLQQLEDDMDFDDNSDDEDVQQPSSRQQQDQVRLYNTTQRVDDDDTMTLFSLFVL